MRVILYLIRSWEFVGGGIACKRLGRNFIGIEIDEKYFRIAQERLDEKEQMSIFDLLKE